MWPRPAIWRAKHRVLGGLLSVTTGVAGDARGDLATGRRQHRARNWLIDVLVQSPLFGGATPVTYRLRNRAFVLSPHQPTAVPSDHTL
jgi:hypothetical protein